jgi:hypothetical protein
MKHHSSIIGWREWIRIPAFGDHPIKVKVDTGARTSALHAEDVVIKKVGKKKKVFFTILPKQRSIKPKVTCEAWLVEMRNVRSSTGHVTKRPVVKVEVKLGDLIWPIEITLVNRDIMGFRMLLGRQAVRESFLVDPGSSFLQKKSRVRKA